MQRPPGEGTSFEKESDGFFKLKFQSYTKILKVLKVLRAPRSPRSNNHGARTVNGRLSNSVTSLVTSYGKKCSVDSACRESMAAARTNRLGDPRGIFVIRLPTGGPGQAALAARFAAHAVLPRNSTREIRARYSGGLGVAAFAALTRSPNQLIWVGCGRWATHPQCPPTATFPGDACWGGAIYYYYTKNRGLIGYYVYAGPALGAVGHIPPPIGMPGLAVALRGAHVAAQQAAMIAAVQAAMGRGAAAYAPITSHALILAIRTATSVEQLPAPGNGGQGLLPTAIAFFMAAVLGTPGLSIYSFGGLDAIWELIGEHMGDGSTYRERACVRAFPESSVQCCAGRAARLLPGLTDRESSRASITSNPPAGAKFAIGYRHRGRVLWGGGPNTRDASYMAIIGRLIGCNHAYLATDFGKASGIRRWAR